MKKHTKLAKPATLTLQRERIRALATGEVVDVAGGMTAKSDWGRGGCPIPVSLNITCGC